MSGGTSSPGYYPGRGRGGAVGSAGHRSIVQRSCIVSGWSVSNGGGTQPFYTAKSDRDSGKQVTCISVVSASVTAPTRWTQTLSHAEPNATSKLQGPPHPTSVRSGRALRFWHRKLESFKSGSFPDRFTRGHFLQRKPPSVGRPRGTGLASCREWRDATSGSRATTSDNATSLHELRCSASPLRRRMARVQVSQRARRGGAGRGREAVIVDRGDARGRSVVATRRTSRPGSASLASRSRPGTATAGPSRKGTLAYALARTTPRRGMGLRAHPRRAAYSVLLDRAGRRPRVTPRLDSAWPRGSEDRQRSTCRDPKSGQGERPGEATSLGKGGRSSTRIISSSLICYSNRILRKMPSLQNAIFLSRCER